MQATSESSYHPLSDLHPTMLVSTLISTFVTAALLCTAAPAEVDATKYAYYTIHWPAVDHQVDLHVARGGGRRPRPINPGSKPWV